MNPFPKKIFILLTAAAIFYTLVHYSVWIVYSKIHGLPADEAVVWATGEMTLPVLLLGAGMYILQHRLIRRLRWLADEAVKIQNGGEPHGPLPGEDHISKLSSALHSAAVRERELRKAMDEHAIVAVTDRQGRITFANDRFCGISGYSREDLIGNTHKIVNSNRHPKEFFRAMWKTIASGRVWRGTIENRAKNGSYYFVATTIVPILGKNDKPGHYIAVRTDITDQKRTTAQLSLLSQELEAKNKDLEILIHAASHDLKAPLVNVKGFASVIGEHMQSLKELMPAAGRKGGSSPEPHEEIFHEIEEAVNFIHASAGKMDALLGGLLLFSKLGKKSLELQTVDPGKTVEESLDATRFQLEAADARVTVNELPPCRADPHLLGQVVSNLIDNALKYRDPRRPLRFEISGFRTGGKCTYRFEDNGMGIAKEHQERIFDLFHRLNPRAGEGHGLGLAIVRRALDRMGGEVTLESILDQGTVFSVTLSAVTESAPALKT